MVFSSITFLFFFLPIVLIVTHIVSLPILWRRRPTHRVKAANCTLLAFSLAFYFWGEQWLIALLGASFLLDYVAGWVISGAGFDRDIPTLTVGGSRTRTQKLALFSSVVLHLTLLGIFKYLGFGLRSYNHWVSLLGADGLRFEAIHDIALPLGISFYTFHSMSYTIDVYRGRLKATRSLLDFACYATLFPQLVAGPIVRYQHVAAHLVQRSVSLPLFAAGITRFIAGLSKKVLIANTVARIADQIFAIPPSRLTPELAWLGVLTYTLQIYFDFSGYSDMAIGLGRMFGFEFPENFNYPYVSRSMTEFWRRWHITLSSWFRDYLYIPLGGNRRAPARVALNLLIVFFLCGLWHGASWTFVVWGLYHGLFLVLERTRWGRWIERLPGPVGRLYTLMAVMGGWAIFRSESLTQAMVLLQRMVGWGGPAGPWPGLALTWGPDVSLAVAAGILFSAPLAPWAMRRIQPLLEGRPSPSDPPGPMNVLLSLGVQGLRVLGASLLFIACAMWLASGTHNPFIYFRF